MVKTDDKPANDEKALVAPKAKYFSPELQASVEADSLDEATKIIEKEQAERKKAAAKEGKE